jgi:hypothetical protein
MATVAAHGQVHLVTGPTGTPAAKSAVLVEFSTEGRVYVAVLDHKGDKVAELIVPLAALRKG